MPRSGRVVLPNTPHYIVQRGHNRSGVFVEPRDFQTRARRPRYDLYVIARPLGRSNLGVEIAALLRSSQ